MTNGKSRQGIERSNRWQSLLLARGLLDATPRAGLRVTRLELSPGRIAAGVADKNLGDRDVSIDMPVWRDEQWTGVIDLLSSQALYAAQMLAGDFPDALEATLQQEGLALLPAQHEAVIASCTCCDAPQSGPEQPAENAANRADRPCPHVDAALRAAGDMLAEDPWLLFHLRGRVREQVLRALRRKRGQKGDANGSAGAGNALQQDVAQPNGLRGGEQPKPDAQPLAEDVNRFWGSARTLEQFRPHIVPPVAELVLLRRLGPPAFSHANEEVFDTLTGVYRRVTEAALALAYAEDPPADTGEAGPAAANGDTAWDQE